jgi:hypothetical protein
MITLISGACVIGASLLPGAVRGQDAFRRVRRVREVFVGHGREERQRHDLSETYSASGKSPGFQPSVCR